MSTHRKSKLHWVATLLGLPRSFIGRLLLAAIPVFWLVLAVATPSPANPAGGSVVRGSATIDQPSSSLTIVHQGSQKAIINWNSFNIQEGEKTQFIQPGRNSIALNRVIRNDPSQILGQLTANGQVWLVNPNGVFFGPHAKVNVAGILATTADITDNNFMAGRYDFSIPSANPAASVINQGAISVRDTGLAGLVAPTVRNDGLIQARLGKVLLGGTPTFTLDFDGDGLIQFQATSKVLPGDQSSPIVANTGKILADGGTVLVTARAVEGVVNDAINLGGLVEARSCAMKNGTIVLDGGDSGVVSVTGTLDASGKSAGQTGGSVTVTGDKVGLFAGSVIDASGDAGGGNVNIGGGRHGADPSIRNANAVYMDPNSKISADATGIGNGGNVVLWSENYTNFQGSISAKGGPDGGNGGQVETSSRNVLDASGSVSTFAPKGKAGDWLLDPSDITITATAPTDYSFTGTFDPTVDQGYISPATIIGGIDPDLGPSGLYAGYVTIQTSAGSGGSGDITVNDPVDTTGQTFSGNKLTLNADRNIGINADILMGTSNDLSLNAAGNINQNAGSITANNLTLGAAGNINQNAGSITANNLTLGAAGSVNQNAGSITANNLYLQGPASFQLNDPANANSIGTLSAYYLVGEFTTGPVGNVTYKQSAPFATSYIYSTGNVNLDVTGANQTLTIGSYGINAGGDITLTADRMNLNLNPGYSIQSTGNLTIAPYTSGTTVGVGSSSASGTLQLPQSYFYDATANPTGFIQNTFSNVIIGSPTTGTITAGDLTFDDNVYLMNTGALNGITINGALNVGANGLLLKSDGLVQEINPGSITAGTLALMGSLLNGNFDLADPANANSVSILTAHPVVGQGGVGTLTYSQSGSFTAADIYSSGNVSLNVTGPDHTLTIANRGISAGSGDISLAADNLDLSLYPDYSIQSTGQLWISPYTSGRATTIGSSAASGTLQLPQSYFGPTGIADSFSEIIIGDGTGAITAGDFTFLDNIALVGSAITINGALNVGDGELSLVSNGTVQEIGSGSITAGPLSLRYGSFNLPDPNGANSVTSISARSGEAGPVESLTYVQSGDLTTNWISSSGPVLLDITGPNALTVGSIITSVNGDVTLVTSGAFTNSYGAGALTASSGRWLVYSADPANDTRGGLPFDFIQYNAPYPTTPAQETGNGFLYSIAPVVTASLTGTVTKTYDGTTTATLGPGNYALSGALDDDTVTLDYRTTGTYDNKNAGTDKTVSVSDLSISATNGGEAPVYGYQLASSSISGNVGVITPAPLTISAVSDSKVYDGTTDSSAIPTVGEGLVEGDSISGLGEVFDSKDAGGRLLYATFTINDGNGGHNYEVTSDPAEGSIDQAPLTIRANNARRIFGGTNPNFSASFSGLVPSDNPSVITALQFETNANRNSPPGKYSIIPFGATSQNYEITYVNGILRVTRSPDPFLPSVIPPDNLSYQFTPAFPANNPLLPGQLFEPAPVGSPSDKLLFSNDGNMQLWGAFGLR